MNATDAAVIADWVKDGGVLVLMANDSANCDLSHFNILANQFGMHFTEASINMVKNNAYETGTAFPVQGNEIFKEGLKFYIKEVSPLNIQAAAKPIVNAGDKVLAAVATYGKGYVLAIGDPWLYNEYIDGRKLPTSFQNFEATQQIVNWIILKSK